jgi:hypothetical protein
MHHKIQPVLIVSHLDSNLTFVNIPTYDMRFKTPAAKLRADALVPAIYVENKILNHSVPIICHVDLEVHA